MLDYRHNLQKKKKKGYFIMGLYLARHIYKIPDF